MTKPRKKFSHKVRQKRLSKVTYTFFDLFQNNTYFFSAIGCCLLLAFMVHPHPKLAMGLGFLLSSYGVIANDSIQTLGVFITANIHKRSKLLMWGFISGVFVLTMVGGWLYFHGDISYGRLAVRGLGEDPEDISFFQLAGPILLPVLTRFRIPVSTTFFLLNSFTNDPKVMQEMIAKSFLGYLVGFLFTFLFQLFLQRMRWTLFEGPPHKIWVPLQWLCTALLWSIWLMQDAANLAVFLPRKMNLTLLLIFLGFICMLLGLLFYTRGGDMQTIVEEKTGVTDIRSATLISFSYMVILLVFTFVSKIPMSTTFVFIGVLGGRELAKALMAFPSQKKKRLRKSLSLILRDLKYSGIGLVMAIILACLVNPTIRQVVRSYLEWS